MTMQAGSWRSKMQLTKYAVYEREARQCMFPNSVVSGSFSSKEEAEAWRQRYGYSDENYYVAEEKPIFTDQSA